MEPNNPTMQTNEALNLQEQTPPPAQTSPSNGKTVAVVLLLIFFFPIGWILMLVWMKWPKWVKILISVLGVLSVIALLGVIASLVLISVNPISTLDRARVYHLLNNTKIACNAVELCTAQNMDVTQCDSMDELETNVHQINKDMKFSIKPVNGKLTLTGETTLGNQKTCAYTCTVNPITRSTTTIMPVNEDACGVKYTTQLP